MDENTLDIKKALLRRKEHAEAAGNHGIAEVYNMAHARIAELEALLEGCKALLRLSEQEIDGLRSENEGLRETLLQINGVVLNNWPIDCDKAIESPEQGVAVLIQSLKDQLEDRDSTIRAALEDLQGGNPELAEIILKNGLSPAPSRWIPVSERLPEVKSKGAVLVLVLCSSGGTPWATIAGFSKYGWDTSLVTHWQPLPAPPKEGGE